MMRRDPLLSVLDSAPSLVAHHRLAYLDSRTVTALDDDYEPSIAPGEPLIVVVSPTRTYRPRGKTLTMLRRMRDNGPQTRHQLAALVRAKPSHIDRMLEAALANGLARRVEGDPLQWGIA